MSLQRYHKKRDFSKTPEPAGSIEQQQRQQVSDTSTTSLRFVVQKHEARRLHYDFRVETHDRTDGPYQPTEMTHGAHRWYSCLAWTHWTDGPPTGIVTLVSIPDWNMGYLSTDILEDPDQGIKKLPVVKD